MVELAIPVLWLSAKSVCSAGQAAGYLTNPTSARRRILRSGLFLALSGGPLPDQAISPLILCPLFARALFVCSRQRLPLSHFLDVFCRDRTVTEAALHVSPPRPSSGRDRDIRLISQRLSSLRRSFYLYLVFLVFSCPFSFQVSLLVWAFKERACSLPLQGR